jgi:hypothetical protein
MSSADGTDQAVMAMHSRSLLLGIFPTVLFCVVAWLCLRAGWSLVPTLAAGYIAWGIFLGVLILLRGGTL